MKKSVTKNLAVSLGAIILLLCVYFLVLRWQPNDYEEKSYTRDERVRLFDFDENEISSIEISNQNGKYVIIKTGDLYSIEEVDSSKVKAAELSKTAMTLANLRSKKEIKTKDIDSFGLEKIMASVHVKTSEGVETTLKIGDETSSGDGHYVTLNNDGAVYLVEKQFINYFLKSEESYINKEVAYIDKDRIELFEIYKGQDKLTQIRKKTNEDNISKAINEKLIMTYPFYEYVSSEKMMKLFDSMSNITAIDYAEELSNDYSTDAYKIVIKDNNKEHILKLSEKKDGKVYARYNEGESFVIDEKWLNTAKSFEPFDYIYKFVQIFSIDDVEEVSVELNGAKCLLSVGKGKYSVNNKNVNEKDFKQLYRDICALSFSAPVENNNKGELIGKITFKLKNGVTDTANYYEYDKLNYMVETSKGENFLISRSSVDECVSKFDLD